MLWFTDLHAEHPAGMSPSLDPDAVAHVYHTGPKMYFAKCKTVFPLISPFLFKTNGRGKTDERVY